MNPSDPSTEHRPSADDPARGATTLLEVLNGLRDAGFGGQLVAKPSGAVRCTECGAETPAGEIDVHGYQRLEGASDAADLNLVAWSNCPACGRGATLLLGYGPNASEADGAVLEDLALDHVTKPGDAPDPHGAGGR